MNKRAPDAEAGPQPTDSSRRSNHLVDRDKEARQERWGLWLLAALFLVFSAIGIYGIETDDGGLQVLGLCGAMPTLFGFLVLLGMRMTWLD